MDLPDASGPRPPESGATSPELSVVVLCYREGERVREVLDPLYEVLAGSQVSVEMVLVCNFHAGSGDPTPDAARAWSEGRENVVITSHEKRGAMGWDMRTGFAASSGHVIVVMDGDSQNPPADVLRAYHEIAATGVDVIKGRRTARGDGLYRSAISTVYNALFRILFRPGPIWDVNGKPKGMTRAAYEAMGLSSDDWFIDAEIILAARRQGLRIGEFPVTFLRNDSRPSFVRPRDIVEFVRNMARARIHRG